MHSAVKIAKKFVDMPDRVSDMTPMKLLKLVYIAHGWMLGLYGRPLVSEDVEAWRYGPVIPEVYSEVKMYGARPIPTDSLPENYSVTLDDEEQNIVTQVYEMYKKFDGVELSAMTHAPGTPWHIVWHDQGSSVIPNKIIQDYYRELSGDVH